MESEAAAYTSAQQKHNQYMRYGKKPRYIEVFQCSGEDMNLVLTGLQPPATASKPALLSPGMLSPAQSTPQSPPNSTHSHTIPHPVQPPLTLAIPPQSSSYLTQSQAALQAQYIAHQNLIARQQTAAANVAAHQEYILFQNCGLLPHHQAAAAAAASAPATIPNYAAQHAQHAAAAAAAAHHPQIIFMTRPTLMPQHPQTYGYLPAPATAAHQWQTAYHHPAAAAAANHAAGLTAVSPLTGVMPTTIKRSYENAFQHDHNSVSNTKRHYTAATAAHPAAALYPHYFPPNV